VSEAAKTSASEARRARILAALVHGALTVPELVTAAGGAWDEREYKAISVVVRRLAAEGVVTREPSRPWHPGRVRLARPA
jgi:hypothetical protein